MHEDKINQLTEDMWNLIDSSCVMPEELAQEIDETFSLLLRIIDRQAHDIEYLRRYKEMRERTW